MTEVIGFLFYSADGSEGPYRLDIGDRRLWGDRNKRKKKETLAKTDQALLLYFLRNHGTPLSRQQITDEVWKGIIVGEKTIAVRVSSIRSVLDDDWRNPIFIDTVKDGYCFIGAVSEIRENRISSVRELGPPTFVPPPFQSEARREAILGSRFNIPHASLREHFVERVEENPERPCYGLPITPKPYVATIHSAFFTKDDFEIHLKRLAIAFEKIAIVDIDTWLCPVPVWIGMDRLSWLYENGIVYNPDFSLNEGDRNSTWHEETLEIFGAWVEKRSVAREFSDKLVAFAGPISLDKDGNLNEKYLKNKKALEMLKECNLMYKDVFELFTRWAALAIHNNAEALPVFGRFEPTYPDSYGTRRVSVVRIAIDRFPVIAPDTRWEEILDFRTDPDSHIKRLALRNWINEMSYGRMGLHEISDKMQWLVEDYANFLRMHRLKDAVTEMDILFTPHAEMLKSLTELKKTSAENRLIRVAREKYALLREERSHPGRQLAFILAAHNRFDDKVHFPLHRWV